MQVQQLNRTDSDRILVIVTNVDGGGSITTGLGVCLVQAGASIDGVSAINSTAAAWEGFVGIAIEDIAINAYGMVCMHGLVQSCLISNVGSSVTVTRGDFLIPGAVAGTMFSVLTDQAMSTLFYKYSIAATTPVAVSTLAQSYCKALVRAI